MKKTGTQISIDFTYEYLYLGIKIFGQLHRPQLVVHAVYH